MSYCDWDAGNEANIRYHDREWGVPLHDDHKQFEFLMMEVMQCGLSWDLMMRKREVFRECFDGFDYDKVAAYVEDDVEHILAHPGIIRSRRKVEAVVNNASCFQQIRFEHGSFSEWLWAHTNNRTILYNKHAQGWIPVSNGLSDRIAKELKAYGFKFLGPTTIYSHLQACGMINDHDEHCPCYERINSANPTVGKRRYKEKGVRFYGNL